MRRNTVNQTAAGHLRRAQRIGANESGRDAVFGVVAAGLCVGIGARLGGVCFQMKNRYNISTANMAPYINGSRTSDFTSQ